MEGLRWIVPKLQLAKYGVALLCVLLLMYGGLQGRQQARLQARVDEITPLRDELQRKLDQDHKAIDQVLGGAADTNVNSGRSLLLKSQIQGLIGSLKAKLEQFDYDHGPAKLPEREDLELRLSKATLANAEQRFADTLKLINSEPPKHLDTLCVPHVRGDAFYGLNQWREALDSYQRIIAVQPDRTAISARVAECQYALGNSNQALNTYAELARSHIERGDGFLIQDKVDAAAVHYEQAIGILNYLLKMDLAPEMTRGLAQTYEKRGHAFLMQTKLDAAIADFEKAIELIEKKGRKELTADVARSHSSRGSALLAQGKLDAAIGALEKSIETFNQLPGHQSDLAGSHEQRGNALLAQGKLDAALGDFDKTIQILTGVIQKEPRAGLINDLARTHNNRGVAYRGQGKVEAAFQDFDTAIKTVANSAEKHGSDTNSRAGAVQMEITMAYSENAVEALLRARLPHQPAGTELEIVRAMSLKNRGYAHQVQGETAAAVGDFQAAMESFTKLVEQEGQSTLALQFARSVSALAWIYATSADNSLRDGNRAKDYALRACELSEWRAFAPVEALAAAWAETGNFPEALKWQQKALELAAPKYRPEVQSRLALYKSGKPYRPPLL